MPRAHRHRHSKHNTNGRLDVFKIPAAHCSHFRVYVWDVKKEKVARRQRDSSQKCWRKWPAEDEVQQRLRNEHTTFGWMLFSVWRLPSYVRDGRFSEQLKTTSRSHLWLRAISLCMYVCGCPGSVQRILVWRRTLEQMNREETVNRCMLFVCSLCCCAQKESQICCRDFTQQLLYGYTWL